MSRRAMKKAKLLPSCWNAQMAGGRWCDLSKEVQGEFPELFNSADRGFPLGDRR